jgi:ketosteroid isomerase-like protein
MREGVISKQLARTPWRPLPIHQILKKIGSLHTRSLSRNMRRERTMLVSKPSHAVSLKRVAVSVLLVAVEACTGGGQETAELFSEYLAASNAHDLPTLDAMTADDIVWRLGTYTLVGKEEALGPHALDAGMHTSLEARDVMIRGDTVECMLIERNDGTRAFEVDSSVHYARYVFRDGLVYRKEPWKEQPSSTSFATNVARFRRWVSEVHPIRLAELDSLMAITQFSLEVGELRSSLLMEWVAAGRP